MNKLILILAVVCGAAVGLAMTFRRDLQHERDKAHALAERVAILEPVERPSDPPTRDEIVLATPVVPAPSPEPAIARGGVTELSLSASPYARRQIERLQAELVNGTPLQDYQARALAAAIDQVRADGDDAESRARLVQAAADILFESQFEKYVALLEREPR